MFTRYYVMLTRIGRNKLLYQLLMHGFSLTLVLIVVLNRVLFLNSSC